MKRLSPLPRIRRQPEAIKLAIRRKRQRRQSTAKLQWELVIQTARTIRQEVRETGPCI